MARARALILIVAALGTIGCDRVTKHAASAYLAGTPDRSFLSDTIRVGYVENTGGFLECSTWRISRSCSALDFSYLASWVGTKKVGTVRQPEHPVQRVPQV